MVKSFKDITILLVEDSDQVRGLITSILRCLGIGEVLKARDGGEAIEVLKTYPQNHSKPGSCGIDLIISDWLMSPVDGISLLRWVRQHQASPNPFMPFIMISGICDTEKITRARDLGGNGFLSKPFSVDAVTGHLQRLLTNENTFVKTDNFFGPDRRKRALETYNIDRRGPLDKPEQVKKYRILSVMPKKNQKTTNESSDEYPIVDPQIMREIRKELAKQTQGFLDVVLKYIHLLESDCKSSANLEESKRKPFFERLNSTAHELRGLGGIFDYPLVAIVAQSLHDLTSIHDLSDDCLGLIKDHINSFKAILRLKINGMGGDIGRELIDALDAANQRFIHRNDQKVIYN